MLALHGGGDRKVDVGEQADRGPAVPGLPADDLSGVKAGALLGKLMIFLDAPADDRDGDQPDNLPDYIWFCAQIGLPYLAVMDAEASKPDAQPKMPCEGGPPRRQS